MFTDKERELLLKAISNEQISMIIKDHTMYADDDYNELEKLKIKIKDMKNSFDDFVSELERLYPNTSRNIG